MDLITKRCHKCRQILLKHEPGAFVEGRKIEVKCKCNAMNYLVADIKAEGTPDPTQGRSKAGNPETGTDRRTAHVEGTA